ncbi:60 kDa SS-A/Ro ribonucleoprotein-like [Agrilus planipennis]|uniref:60 kDa SS-A/Ro ribonucleoprotein-like n=1 Tax=Agrilus planipennis TaxID=224129 RepID=A0A7F5R4L0_AGRPL|nr:60 kDa SS-A/Ro ribonucleoprotein-like [Agrilus planipennis]
MATSKNKATPENRIKRYLYLYSEDLRFVTGNPEVYKYYTVEKAKAVTELIEANKIDTILNIVEIVNSENTLPGRATLFFILAVVARTNLVSVPDTVRNRVYTTALSIMRSTEEFFMFIRFCTLQKRSFPSGLNKLIGEFYLKKEPMDLVKEISKSKGFHSWTHKDLLKLSHCKTDDKLISLIMTYVLFDLGKAESMAAEYPESESIISYLKKVTELKKCKDEKQISELITELGCTSLIQVPSHFHNSQAVWEALLPNLPFKELTAALPKLYKLGFLKANTTFQTKVVEAITNANTLKSSKIHPVQVFIRLRNFEKGGKPLDPQFLEHMEKKALEMKLQDENYKKPELTCEAPKCPSIISALHKALQISFHNLRSIGKRIMITFDTVEKMKEPCLHCKNLSCFDAATIMTLSLLRTEKDVVVAAFNDDKPVTILSFEKNITLNQALSQLKELKSKFVMPSQAIEWAQNNKKPIDVFIHFLYGTYSFAGMPKKLRSCEKTPSTLSSYRKKMSLPHTKLITFSLSSPRSVLVGNEPNTLEICGFSEEVPKVVEAFCRGLFN